MMKQNKSSMAKSSCPYSNKLNSALHPTNWSWILLCHLALSRSWIILCHLALSRTISLFPYVIFGLPLAFAAPSIFSHWRIHWPTLHMFKPSNTTLPLFMLNWCYHYFLTNNFSLISK